MDLHITINIYNAAFDVAPAFEVGRILLEYADRELIGEPTILRDINGDFVGKAELYEVDMILVKDPT